MGEETKEKENILSSRGMSKVGPSQFLWKMKQWASRNSQFQEELLSLLWAFLHPIHSFILKVIELSFT